MDGFLLQNRWTLEGLMNFRAGFSFLLLLFVGFQVATEVDAVEAIGVGEHHLFYHSKIKHRTCWTSWILCTIFYPTIFRSRYTTIHLGGSLSGRVWNSFGHSVSWTFFLSHLHYSSVDHMRSWGEALEVFTQLAVSDVTEHKIVGIGRSFRFPKIETKKLGNSRLESNMKHLCVCFAADSCFWGAVGVWMMERSFCESIERTWFLSGWYGESSFLLNLQGATCSESPFEAMKSGEHVVIHQRFIDTKALTSHLMPIPWLRHHRKGARTAVQSRPRGLEVDRISRCPDEWKLIHLWKRTQDNLPRPSCLQFWVNIQNYKLKARYWKSWKQVPMDGFRCNKIPALSITSWNHGVGSKWKQLTLLTLCHKTSMRHASQVDHSHCSFLEFSDHFDKTNVRRWMFPFDICSFLPHLKSLLVTRWLLQPVFRFGSKMKFLLLFLSQAWAVGADIPVAAVTGPIWRSVRSLLLRQFSSQRSAKVDLGKRRGTKGLCRL